MSDAVTLLHDSQRRLLWIQLLLVVGAAGVYLALKGVTPAVAALLGGAIAVANTLVLIFYGWRAVAAGDDVQRNMRMMIAGVVVRFALTIALFAVGLALLRLEPLPMLGGFIAGQLAQLIRWL